MEIRVTFTVDREAIEASCCSIVSSGKRLSKKAVIEHLRHSLLLSGIVDNSFLSVDFEDTCFANCGSRYDGIEDQRERINKFIDKHFPNV